MIQHPRDPDEPEPSSRPSYSGSSWQPRQSWARRAMVVVAVLVVGLAAVGAYQGRDGGAGRESASSPTLVVQPNSYRLSTADDGKVTLVEFVDFECESCDGPGIQKLRSDYQRRVTLVARYFPSESHPNAQRAARAVEAAAQQGQFAAMYTKMIETQADWSGRQDPQDELFRGFAADLGLDLRAWDAAYGSDATWERIQADIDDGLALGVTSTPGFFLNGAQIKPKSLAELKAAVDEALAQ